MVEAMKRYKWLTRSAGVLFLVILAANLYVFFTREWESSFSPASYATLYYVLDVPTIREWKVLERDRLQLDIACTHDIKEWTVLTDGSKEQSAIGMTPSFRIDTTFSQLHTYRLTPVPENTCPAIEISIRFYSREFYGSLGMKRTDAYIVRSSVPCGEFEQFSLSDWTDDYDYVGTDALVEVARILRQEVGLRDSDATFVRMEKLMPYLRNKLQASGGVPKDDERWMNPWLLYNEMAGGTGKGWCTQNAQVWVFWANRAGIPTRFVFNARTQDNTIVYTGHAFAESYIREQNRWAYVDLSKGHIYVTNKEGKVLNTAELLELNQQNAFDSTFARVFADSLSTVPYAQCNDVVRSEFTPHSILKYRRPPNVEDVRNIYTGFFRDRTFLLGNLERYLFKPQLAYSLYPTEGAETYLVRRVLFFALVAALVLWLGILRGVRRLRRQGSALPSQ